MEEGGGHGEFREHSFSFLVEKDDGLSSLRKSWASKPADERRMAADLEYNAGIASDIFESALERAGEEGFGSEYWPPGVTALAVDPEYAPALLTVGSIEYQLGRRGEALELFMKLTRLGKDEEDLPEIIDKAGCFLISQKDYENALELYSAAGRSDPGQALYFNSWGYCLGKLGRYEESVAKNRQAVALEPASAEFLNDLGFSLMEAGEYLEAEKVLEKSKSLAPPDYHLPANNLEELRERKAEAGRRGQPTGKSRD